MMTVMAMLSLLLGCTTHATLTLYSQPEGAYITHKPSGYSYGIAPVSVSYAATELAQHPTADGCYLVAGFDAQWVSGTTASLETIKLCGSPVGDYTISFNRDRSAPGLDKDMQFALQVQSIRAQQQQAAAAESAAITAILGSMGTRSSSLRCTSRQVGSIVLTDCK